MPVVIQSRATRSKTRPPQPGGPQVYGYLTDQECGVLDFFQATPTLDPAQVGESLRKRFEIITNRGGRRGPLEVRVLVRDPVGATWGSLRLPVTCLRSPQRRRALPRPPCDRRSVRTWWRFPP